MKASAEDRSNYGLNLMAIGIIIPLAVPIISIVLGIVAPTVVLPGRDFYGLSLILLPLTFAFALTGSQIEDSEVTGNDGESNDSTAEEEPPADDSASEEAEPVDEDSTDAPGDDNSGSDDSNNHGDQEY